MSHLEEKENKKRIFVIEDIDSIFMDRKKNDDQNSITLQGLLNCFDGFSCLEGTLLFITANKPEFLDYAMLRSCRVDHKFNMDYADKYQTRCIFEILHSNDPQLFKNFYKLIKNKKYTTAMLQEFLFYNRNSVGGLVEKVDDFFEIIEKNNPESFTNGETEKNIYM